MLAPEDATVFGQQGDDISGYVGYEALMRLVDGIESWPNVNTADVSMAEHGVGQASGIEESAESTNEGGHFGDRDGAVFDEGRWPGLPRGNFGQQTDRVGSDLPSCSLHRLVANNRH